MSASSKPPRLALHGITKRYPAVLANDDVNLQVGDGEIHALLGENGAGKSTLMKIVYGVVRPDSGSIGWEGAPVAIDSPATARRLVAGGVRVATCWDVVTVHRLTTGRWRVDEAHGWRCRSG